MKFPNLYKFKIDKRVTRKFSYTLYEAVDQTSGEAVHLRVLNDEIARRGNHVVSFLNAARMLKLFNNPYVSQVVDYGNDQGIHFLATEKHDYKPLHSLIQETFSLSLQDFLEIFIRIGKTIRDAHLQGITHGWLNPKNIFINSEGALRIDDFGFSWSVQEVFNKDNAGSRYLANYISPEFYDSTNLIDGRADLYSIGATMYHLLTGRPPYNGRNMAEIKEQHLQAKFSMESFQELALPGELETMVSKALNHGGDDRYLNLKELLDSLEKLKQNAVDLSDPDEQFVTAVKEVDYTPHYSEKYFMEEDAKAESILSMRLRNLFGAFGSVLRSRVFLFSFMIMAMIFMVVVIGQDKLKSFLPSSSEGYASVEESEVLPNPVTPIAGILPETSNSADVFELIPDIEREIKDISEKVNIATGNPYTGKEILPRDLRPARSSATKRSAVKKESNALAAGRARKTSTKTTPTKNAAARKAPVKPSANKKAVAKKTPVKTSAKGESGVAAKLTSVTFAVNSGQDSKGAAIFVNGQFKGKTDASGNLRVPGLEIGKPYSARISKNGYKTITKDFTASKNSSAIDLDMRPKKDIFGTLILDATPKADSIFVDGKLYRGKAPLNITLPWGEHRVRYVNTKSNKSWEQVVHLKVGQVLRVKHDFVKREFGKVAVSLKNAATFGFGFVYIDGKLWDGGSNTTPLELTLPVGSHTIEVRRDGFTSVPRDIIVVVDKRQTKYVSFTFSKIK